MVRWVIELGDGSKSRLETRGPAVLDEASERSPRRSLTREGSSLTVGTNIWLAGRDVSRNGIGGGPGWGLRSTGGSGGRSMFFGGVKRRLRT